MKIISAQRYSAQQSYHSKLMEQKQNHKRTVSIKPQEKKKTSNQRVTLIWLQTIKCLNNKNNKMAGITAHLSILTLNVNRLNTPIKGHGVAN
jgi:tRNA splicing ligase